MFGSGYITYVESTNATQTKGQVMNRTKAQLADENESLRNGMAHTNEQLEDLVNYLLSDKFHEDPTVQIQDVLNRLEPALRTLGRYLVGR